MLKPAQFSKAIPALVLTLASCVASAQDGSLIPNTWAEWGPGESPDLLREGKMTASGRAALRVNRKALALPGPNRELAGGPMLAAEEAYANRAYPAADVPVAATRAAQAAFKGVASRGLGRRAAGTWSLAGPSIANYPAVLSFSGHDYVGAGRVTALAISPDCAVGARCRVWAGAAGGGVWRTDNALAGSGPTWVNVSASFDSNAIGTLYYDAPRATLYAGTGEPNASSDSAAGMGLYKSTDGGDSWTKLAGVGTAASVGYVGPFADGRAISSVAVHPTNANIIYVGTARGVRGVASTGGATSNPPSPVAPFGLWKSVDGGATFTLIWTGNASLRGVNRVALDPSDPSVVYAAAFQQGVWRSLDQGATFSRILAPVAPASTFDRAEFAVNRLSSGKTRMYVGDGAQGSPGAQLFRTDDAAGVASFTNITSVGSFNYCTAQCWYDNFVYSPPGYPDIVYLGGSFAYTEFGGPSNGRAVVLSTDAGVSFTDMTWDASSDTAPNGLHPDHHALVTVPGNPLLFINGSDGGLFRSSGTLTNISYQCATRGLSSGDLAKCQQLLSKVPSHLYSLNKLLPTLQFTSISVSPLNPKVMLGGTQDNGTYLTTGSNMTWPAVIYGDGGNSGLSSANAGWMFNTFTFQGHSANFRGGDPTKWVVIGGPIAASPEASAFYPPIIADPHPAAGGTIFQGSQSVWRTQDWGGNIDYLEANCADFTTAANNAACGNFVRISPLLVLGFGATRTGGTMAALARTTANTGTLWAATSAGRLFISSNADANPASSVSFTRLDSLAANSPGRFITAIAVDPANPNRAFVAYSGYNFNTPLQPGHVFAVTYNGGSSVTWQDLSYDLGDLPATGLAYDSVTGDLYASSDFGVMRLPQGTSSWVLGGSGLPVVEVSSLTILPQARKLIAATHGRSVWQMTLP